MVTDYLTGFLVTEKQKILLLVKLTHGNQAVKEKSTFKPSSTEIQQIILYSQVTAEPLPRVIENKKHSKSDCRIFNSLVRNIGTLSDSEKGVLFKAISTTDDSL